MACNSTFWNWHRLFTWSAFENFKASLQKLLQSLEKGAFAEIITENSNFCFFCFFFFKEVKCVTNQNK